MTPLHKRTIKINYQGNSYKFDTEEPGYSKQEEMIHFLKHKQGQRYCAICNDVIVYFSDRRDTADQSATYICIDCYNKALD